jgi:DNA polymerase-4
MVGGLKHERGVVACPSYEARALGVYTGTALWRAAELIPDGIFLKGDFNRYEHYSRMLFDILLHYSPVIQKISQDEACLDITGTIRHHDSAPELAIKLQNEILQNLGLSTSIGIAPSRIAAKIASEHQKPLGITILDENNINSFFEKLPIGKIPGIGRVTEKILHEMGIRTAGQLAQIPAKYLESIFGINGLKFSSYARGEDGLAIREYNIIRSVSRETGFSDDITDMNILLPHFYYLLERACRKIRGLSKKSASIKIKFRYTDFKTVEGAARISPVSHDENFIFPIIETIFRRLFTRRVGIRLVGVTLGNLRNYAELDSFLDDRTEKNRRLLKSLDSARGKEGFFAVTTGRTLSLSTRYKRADNGYELRTPGLSQ